MKTRLLQGSVLVAGVGLSVYALGLYFLWPEALQLWIWPETPALGCVFVAGVLAAAAAPLVWIGLTGQLSALRAPMLTGIVADTGIALHLFFRRGLPGNARYLPFAVLFAFGAVLAVIVFVWAGRVPRSGDREDPPAIRWAFVVFAALLLPVGVALVLDVPNVFPIPLTPDMAAVYGWFFLGSFAYYAYGAWAPSRLNSTGQLLSFLIYDLLLIPPYAGFWSGVYPASRLSLLVYVGVLLASAVFCTYFLLLDSRTRLGGSGAARLASPSSPA